MSDEAVLPTIQAPADLARLSAPERERLAAEIRHRICETVDKTGGHFGAGMGVVELTIALHTVFESPQDRIVWDTSHQCYPHKLLTGRQDVFHTLRQYGGMSGFCHKGESEHDTAFAGHAGTAVSIALGIAEANARAGRRDRHAIAVVGDSALVSGMTLEALNHAGWIQAPVIFVLNDNGMSIDYPVGGLHLALEKTRPWTTAPEREKAGVSDREAFLAAKRAEQEGAVGRVADFFERFGLSYQGPVDGHDSEALIAACERAKRAEGPVLLHVHTRKGAGWELAYDDPVTWHAAQCFLDPRQPKQKKARTWTHAFADALIELGGEDERVVALTAGMPGGTGLDKFRKQFPARTYDVGIAEQHGVGFASGLQVGGLRPVVAVYSTFLQRAFDQVVHDVAIQGNPLVFAMDRGGLVGADGVTHQGLFDISYLRCIPDVVLAAPADEPELKAMLRWALESERIVGLRWPRGAVPQESLSDAPDPIALGRGQTVAVGDGSVAFFTYGALVEEALAARARLAEEGLNATVINARFAKPVDADLLATTLAEHEVVIAVEDHSVVGGFGSACLEAAVATCPERVGRLRLAGVPDDFVHHGARELQLRDAGLDAEGLAARARQHLPTRRRRVLSSVLARD